MNVWSSVPEMPPKCFAFPQKTNSDIDAARFIFACSEKRFREL